MHLVVQLVERCGAASRGHRARRSIVFRRDWMFSAWISGLGLKNSFRIGISSLADEAQRCRASIRTASRSSKAKFGRSGGCVGRLRAAELFEQVGADAARVEELLQLHAGELADLLLGVVGAALLADAGADLLHDLLDVDRVGAHVEIRHGQGTNGW